MWADLTSAAAQQLHPPSAALMQAAPLVYTEAQAGQNWTLAAVLEWPKPQFLHLFRTEYNTQPWIRLRCEAPTRTTANHVDRWGQGGPSQPRRSSLAQ